MCLSRIRLASRSLQTGIQRPHLTYLRTLEGIMGCIPFLFIYLFFHRIATPGSQPQVLLVVIVHLKGWTPAMLIWGRSWEPSPSSRGPSESVADRWIIKAAQIHPSHFCPPDRSLLRRQPPSDKRNTAGFHKLSPGLFLTRSRIFASCTCIL